MCTALGLSIVISKCQIKSCNAESESDEFGDSWNTT